MTFSMADHERFKERVKDSEGCRLKAYRCPSGALTVGYGHNCDAWPVEGVRRVGDAIEEREAERLLEGDLAVAVRAVRRALPWVLGLGAARQAVLYDMAFNMGIGSADGSRGLLSFRNTLALVREGLYAQAARNMLLSRWARQVKGRARVLARQMETGEWQ